MEQKKSCHHSRSSLEKWNIEIRRVPSFVTAKNGRKCDAMTCPGGEREILEQIVLNYSDVLSGKLEHFIDI